MWKFLVSKSSYLGHTQNDLSPYPLFIMNIIHLYKLHIPKWSVVDDSYIPRESAILLVSNSGKIIRQKQFENKKMIQKL